jgi:hypothetical protein
MITTAQIKALRATLHALDIVEDKEALVLQYTNNRTSSLREMQYAEAKAMLIALNPNPKPKAVDDSVKRMRGRITAMAHELGWVSKNGQAYNYQKLDDWMLTHSYLKKRIFDYTKAELPKLVSQVSMLLKNNLKSI